MSKKTKKQENLFISTQQDATQAQMMVPSDLSLNFKVEETFKCPIYLADKPEWVDSLNKASDCSSFSFGADLNLSRSSSL